MTEQKSKLHCKGCLSLRDYWPDGRLSGRKCKWCSEYSRRASSAVGECKLKGGKRVKND